MMINFTRLIGKIFVFSLLVISFGCAEEDVISEENLIEAASSASTGNPEGGSGIADGVIYALPELGGSGIDGTVTITDLGVDGSHIFVDLNNTDKDTTYPLHIHLGAAGGGGGVIAPLNNVDGATGTSTTIVTHREDTGEVFDYDQITGIDEYYIAAHRSTHTGDVVARGNIGVADPMPFPCEDCAGEVSNLTMVNDGAEEVSVEVRQQVDNEQVFLRDVAPGEEFSFFGTRFTEDGNSFGSFVEIFVDGESIGRIDTTCDVSIGPGLRIGDFEIVMGFSTLVHGPLCPFEDTRECSECDGKVSELRLQYAGTTDAMVRVEQHKGEVVYNNLISPNQVITFDGEDKKNTLGPKIKVFIDNEFHTEIHTSCSVPIGPGLVSGLFTVVSGESRNGEGPLCPVDNPMDGDCQECDGGVSGLTLQLTESEMGRVIVKGKKDDEIYFDGMVSPNEEFTLLPLNGDDKLDKTIRFFFNGREKGSLHTSCSEPIGPGTAIRGFEVTEAFSRDGGMICPVENPPMEDGCQECDGGVTELSVELTKNETGRVVVKGKDDDEVYFDGMVSPGEEFTLLPLNGDDKLDKTIRFFFNGREKGSLHTSCSQPIGPGTAIRGFEVTEAFSRDGGMICPVENPPMEDGCQECDGGVTELSVELTKNETGRVVVKGKKDDEVYFDGMVSPGEEFTLLPLNGDDKLDKTIRFFFNGREKGSLHTSCSQPIGPGTTISGFEVTEAFSRDGGMICPVEEDDEDDDDEEEEDEDDENDENDDEDDENDNEAECDNCDGKIDRLTFNYKGFQTIQVRVEQKKEGVIYDQTVSPGSDIVLVGQDKKGTLGTEISIFINDELFEEIHTSCSEPLAIGFEYGNILEITDGSSRNGGELCRLDDSGDDVIK